ncbi:MAG: methylmalonyl Co-A mutase-associated GTPase MeaB [Bacteroidetes bacterium]|nr:methylmalonyl Co-A mutase-associated GTPase MeaB [Bacteroidota bacterium]
MDVSSSENIQKIITGVLNSDISFLSKAITLAESFKPEHQLVSQKIIDNIISHTGKSFRIGITGVPGVGKSSFIEKFGLELANKGFKIAVLAVDPSSTKSKGSILGDKTRMDELSKHPNVFIRPSPSAGELGGLTKSTYQSILLCEAAGYNRIIIETVGVGQSETLVHQVTDFFLLLMLAGAGDELQGIKRGIMEMADVIAITKADGSNIEKSRAAKIEYARALHLFPPNESGWIPKSVICSSLLNSGISDIVDLSETFLHYTTQNGFFNTKRNSQVLELFNQLLNQKIIQNFFSSETNRQKINSAISKIKNNDKNFLSLINEVLGLH